MDFTEVNIEIVPFSEEFAEIVIAAIEELPFESFVVEAPVLKGYIPKSRYSLVQLKEALADVNELSLFKTSVKAYNIASQNWNALWESNFDPIVVAGKCTIKASFHKGLPKSRYNITIDPKMAFGTGHHQTTSLMVEAILAADIKGKKVLDMGCGTGILAILAAKMGAATPVDAIDIDPVAVESARENSRKNRVGGKVELFEGDSSLIAEGKYDIILANINRNIILKDMVLYAKGLKQGGVLILSGFYADDNEMVIDEANKYNLSLIGEMKKDGWSVIKFLYK
jgi:Ribosomal protein L11 methylase